MKNTIITISFLGLLTFSCSNETKVVASDVPPAVSAALMAKYPDANDIKWEMEKNDDRVNYEAEFESGGKNKEVLFSADGTFIKED
jgi:hypothetical protein